MRTHATRPATALVVAAGMLASLGAPSALAEPGLYIAGELGISSARKAKMRDDDPNSPDCFIIVTTYGDCNGGRLDKLGTGWTFGIALGYQFPGPFRADVTFHHRAGYELRGWDPAGTYFDPPVKTDTTMVNGYYDIPVTWKSFKPFVGAGIGRTKNDMDAIKWIEEGCCTGTLTGGKKTSTAWQITLGADLVLEKKWVLQLLYRYTDLGEIRKDPGADQVGSFGTGSGGTGGATGKLRVDEFVAGLRRSFR